MIKHTPLSEVKKNLEKIGKVTEQYALFKILEAYSWDFENKGYVNPEDHKKDMVHQLELFKFLRKAIEKRLDPEHTLDEVGLLMKWSKLYRGVYNMLKRGPRPQEFLNLLTSDKYWNMVKKLGWG